MDYSVKDVQFYPDLSQGVFGDSGFKKLALPKGVAQDTLFIILILFFIFYCIVSSVLFYHWRTYGMKNKMIIVAQTLFTVVSLTLFWAALLVLTSI